ERWREPAAHSRGWDKLPSSQDGRDETAVVRCDDEVVDEGGVY
ncbi:hypothetical protein Tco_0049074, partial [Tanacetum coccineum]